MLIVGGLVVWLKVRHSAEAAIIMGRYANFKRALTEGDEATITALTAPAFRGGPNPQFDWIRDHAGELNEKSRVSIRGSEATIVPHRSYHYLIIPGGNGVKLIKDEGAWYFTGGISID